MASISRIEDVGRLLDAWDVLEMEERLLAIRQVEVAVELDAVIVGELRNVRPQGAASETDDAGEGGRGRVDEELFEEGVACLSRVSVYEGW